MMLTLYKTQKSIEVAAHRVRIIVYENLAIDTVFLAYKPPIVTPQKHEKQIVLETPNVNIGVLQKFYKAIFFSPLFFLSASNLSVPDSAMISLF